MTGQAVTFDEWWKQTKPAECDELKGYFLEAWNTAIAAGFGISIPTEAMEQDIAAHVRRARAVERELSRALVERCRNALAEELAAWDIDPPLRHVKATHDACVEWLATHTSLARNKAQYRKTHGGWLPMCDAPRDAGPVLLLVPTRWSKRSTHIQVQGEWIGSYWACLNADEAIQRVEPIGWRLLHALPPHVRPNTDNERPPMFDEQPDDDPHGECAAELATLRSQLAHWKVFGEHAECERSRLQAGHDRYQVARRMSPAQWRDAWVLNQRTGKPFDEIVADLAPFFGLRVEPNAGAKRAP